MNYKESNVVFVVHEDTYSGAPIAVLGLLQNLHTQYGSHADLYVLYGKQGGLAETYKKYTRSTIVQPESSFRKRLLHRMSGKNYDYSTLVNRISGYDIVVLCTVATMQYFALTDLHRFKKIALCVFEMPVATELYLQEDLNKFSAIDVIFSPSPLLSAQIARYKDVQAPVLPLNQFIDSNKLLGNADKMRQSSVNEVNKPFVAGMIGAPGWPKAVDYFICIAKMYFHFYPASDVKFLWKGLEADPKSFKIYSSDIEKAGLSNHFIFEGRSAHVADFYEKIDVLALSSREDTYPNVMIEAALFGKPTICFSESGGAEYFVKQFHGFAVPFLDIFSFCESIHTYSERRDILADHGVKAERFAIEQHCNGALILDQFTKGLSALSSDSCL